MIRCAACGEWTKEPSLCRGAQGAAGDQACPGGVCAGCGEAGGDGGRGGAALAVASNALLAFRLTRRRRNDERNNDD
jgi:hypothetical protein